MPKTKITTGANDRPKDATIARTGPGLPDDSSTPVDVSDEEIARIEGALQDTMPPPEPPYDVRTANTAAGAEDVDRWGDAEFEEQVRHEAYLLWERDGRPEGNEKHYWFRALEGSVARRREDNRLQSGLVDPM